MLRLLAALSLGFATGCGTTVRPGQMGLRYIALEEPALRDELHPEGFYFQWPWNDIVTYDVTWQSRDEDIEVLTQDDLHVPTTATVTYRPRSSQLHDLHVFIGPSYYEDIIRPTFMTLFRAEFARHNHNDLARESPVLEAAVLEALRDALTGKPLEVDRVSIKHIRFDQAVTKSISEKLVKEQELARKQFEVDIAEQEAEIARRVARGRADAVQIEAEGEAGAIVLRGRAQAEAQKEIAATLTPHYIQYKAFDGDSTRYYFLPIGDDGLPLLIDPNGTP